MPAQPSFVQRRRAVLITGAAVVIFGVIVAVAAVVYGPRWLTRAVRLRTGFDITAKRLSLNPFTGHLSGEELEVRNPPTFPLPEFLEFRRIEGHLRIRSLFSGPLIFDGMELDVPAVTLVRRKDGLSNVQALRRNLLEFGGRRAASGDRHAHDEPTFVVRQLRLQVGQLQLADYSHRLPSAHTQPLDIDQAYLDVQEVSDLLEPATLARLAPVALAVSDYLPAEFAELLQGAAAEAGVPDAQPLAPTDFKPTFDALEESRKP